MAGRPHLNLVFTTVRFEPLFFIIIVMLGIGAPTFGLLVGWVVIATASILIHELGHALAFRAFGSRSSIVLHGLGGLTSGAAQSPGRSIVVSLAGPLLPLVAFGLPALWYLRSGEVVSGTDTWYLLVYAVWINIAWSILNLLPMLPLDGGNILASAITLVTGRDGVRPTRYVSIVVAVGLAAYAFVAFEWLFGIMLAALIVVTNWSALKGTPAGIPFVSGARRPPVRPAAPGGGGPGAAWGPAEGGSAAAPTLRPDASVQDLLVGGYRALDRHESAAALAAAERAMGSRPSGEVLAMAVELAAWALLQQARVAEARALLGRLPSGRAPNEFLAASVSIAEGQLDEGLDLMAGAFVRSESGPKTSGAGRVSAAVPGSRTNTAPGTLPNKVQGANFVASAGLTRELAERLVAQPEGIGLVPAMRFQSLLSSLGRASHAALVDEVLLGGA